MVVEADDTNIWLAFQFSAPAGHNLVDEIVVLFLYATTYDDIDIEVDVADDLLRVAG